MDYDSFADTLVQNVGGKDNITGFMHCMTRLRFTLADSSKADTEAIKNLPGVQSVVNAAGQYQVIVGDHVVPLYEAISEAYGLGAASASAPKAEAPKGIKGIGSAVLGYVSGTMIQVLPLFIGCGLFSLIQTVVQLSGIVPTDSSTYAIITAASKVVFYFLPAFVGYAGAAKLGASPMLGAASCLFLMHPSIAGFVGAEEPATFFGLTVPAIDYSSSVFPALIGVWIMSYVERFVNNHTAGALKTMLVPFVTLLVMFPLMLFVIGPVGYYIGQGLAQIVLALSSLPMGLGCGLVAAFQPLLVMFGAHTVLAAPMIQAISTLGYDALVRPAFLSACFASFGTLIAMLFRAKTPSAKAVISFCAFSQFMGGAEPAIYGLYIPLIKPFVTTAAGSLVAGMVSSILGAKAYAMGMNGIMGMFIFGDTTLAMVAGVLAGAAVSFALTWIVGFDESMIESSEA